jgi:ribosomal protein L7/L12
MATNNLFRSIAWALRETLTDTYALLATSEIVESFVLADRADREAEIRETVREEINDLESQVYNLRAQVHYPEYPHDMLVAAALGHNGVMEEVRNGKKINAIKALRNLTRFNVGDLSVVAGLKAAKEAVEDPRVMAQFDTANEPLADYPGVE